MSITVNYKAQYFFVCYVVTQVCVFDYGEFVSLSAIRLSTATLDTL